MDHALFIEGITFTHQIKSSCWVESQYGQRLNNTNEPEFGVPCLHDLPEFDWDCHNHCVLYEDFVQIPDYFLYCTIQYPIGSTIEVYGIE